MALCLKTGFSTCSIYTPLVCIWTTHNKSWWSKATYHKTEAHKSGRVDRNKIMQFDPSSASAALVFGGHQLEKHKTQRSLEKIFCQTDASSSSLLQNCPLPLQIHSHFLGHQTTQVRCLWWTEKSPTNLLQNSTTVPLLVSLAHSWTSA